MIHFTCAHCRKPLAASAAKQGMSFSCPLCAQPVTVPAAPGSPLRGGVGPVRSNVSGECADATVAAVSAPRPVGLPAAAPSSRSPLPYLLLAGLLVVAMCAWLAATGHIAPPRPSTFVNMRRYSWVAYAGLFLLLSALSVGMGRAVWASSRWNEAVQSATRHAGSARRRASSTGTAAAVVVGLVATAAFYLALWTFVREGYVFDFFVARGVFQYLSTFLFFLGLAVGVSRYAALQNEDAGLQFAVRSQTLGPDEAAALAKQVLATPAPTMPGRHIAEFLRGYARGEPLRPLMETLTAKSRDELASANALLGSLRSALPVMGLLGTVVGLSQAMLNFTWISSAADIESLRHILQQFAKSASTAFDTTLLGLSYMLVLSIVLLALGAREERLVAKLEDVLESISQKFRPHQPQAGLEQVIQGAAVQVMRNLEQALGNATARVMETFRAEMQQGTSAVVHGYLQSWREELLRTSREVLDAVVVENQRANAEAGRVIGSGIELLAGKLDAMGRALERPHPLRIKIIGENSGHEEPSYGQAIRQ